MIQHPERVEAERLRALSEGEQFRPTGGLARQRAFDRRQVDPDLERAPLPRIGHVAPPFLMIFTLVRGILRVGAFSEVAPAPLFHVDVVVFRGFLYVSKSQIAVLVRYPGDLIEAR